MKEARIKELVRNAMEGGMNCADVSLSECIEFAVRTAIAESAQPEGTVLISRLLLLSMGTDHVVRGGPGPLFGAGWAAACEHWSKKLLAEERLPQERAE